MSTVVIEQARIQITVEQLIEAVRQLSPTEQRQVRQAIDEVNWQDRFRVVLEEIDSQVAEQPISEDEIRQEVEAVRNARYQQGRH